MIAQIDQARAGAELARTQARWEVIKALAAFAAGLAVFGGLVIGVANFILPERPQITFPPGTTITVPSR